MKRNYLPSYFQNESTNRTTICRVEADAREQEDRAREEGEKKKTGSWLRCIKSVTIFLLEAGYHFEQKMN